MNIHNAPCRCDPGGPSNVTCGKCIALESLPKPRWHGITREMAMQAMTLRKAKVPLPEDYWRACEGALK